MFSDTDRKQHLLRRLFFSLLMTVMVGVQCGCDNGSDDDAEIETPNSEVIVIAHRGASGYLPEHTLEAYELAIELGADYIEPDLQFTSDGELVAMHDDTLDRTTNVEDLFPDAEDYNVSSFTLEQIKTLTVEPTGTASTSYADFTPTYDNAFKVPTFQEVITLAKKLGEKKGKIIGLYPEAKQGDEVMGEQIIDTLYDNDLLDGGDYVYIQSFSTDILQYISEYQATKGTSIPLIALGYIIDTGNGTYVFASGLTSSGSFSDTAVYADGVGLYKDAGTYPVSETITYNFLEVTEDIVTAAHEAGLLVHIWTFSEDDEDAAATEYAKFLSTGIDGFFTNYTDLGVTARNTFLNE